MGAWIETFGINDSNVYTPVAPYMGAWIETFRKKKNFVNKQSHPTWVRGLKLIVRAGAPSAEQVAPYMGAWIETGARTWCHALPWCRTLHGCVD